MRLRAGYVMVLVAVLSYGCSRDGQVNADLDALDTFTKELVNKITSAKNPVEGVAAGQEYLESQKEDIQTRMKRMGSVRGFQIDKETKDRLAKSITTNVTEIMSLKIKMMSHTMRNKNLDAQLQKLIDDYTRLIKP